MERIRGGANISDLPVNGADSTISRSSPPRPYFTAGCGLRGSGGDSSRIALQPLNAPALAWNFGLPSTATSSG